MPRIEWTDDADANGELAEIYQAWKGANPNRERMPDILKCFSARPDFLRQVIAFSYELHFSDGHLTWQTKEMLATYVSALNQCPYCASSHAYFLEMKGAPDAVVKALHRADLSAAPVSDAERALLDFARLLTERSWQTTDSDAEQLRQVGWTDPQIAEAVYIIAMFNFFNRVANAFGLEPSNYREILGRARFPGTFGNPFSTRPAE